MKKLLVLALVLGLASVANADVTGVELSFGGETDGPGTVMEVDLVICDTIVIDVIGPADLDYLAVVTIMGSWPLITGGEWGDDQGPPYEEMCNSYYYEVEGYPIAYEAAGDIGGADPLAYIRRYEYADWGYGYEISAASSTSVPGGLQFEMLYHCCGPISEYVTISLWDWVGDWTTPDDTIVIHQIPEPMTIALLGLGGLFLLRRRK